MTEYERACLKRDCVKIAIENGTKQGIEKKACLDIAEKIYSFVIGQDASVSKKQGTTG